MFSLLRSLVWIALLLMFIFSLMASVAFIYKKKVWGCISSVLIALCIVVMFVSMAYINPVNISYTLVTGFDPVGFVTEDPKTNRVVWGRDGEQYFRDVRDCEIVIFDEEVASTDKPGESSMPTLPCLQISRTESYSVIKAFGHVFCSRPDVRDIYRFYVPETYLDNPEFDWDLLYQIKE